MPNHIHLVFRHITKSTHKDGNDHQISEIFRNLKRYTARKCNEILGRSGAFWQAESYDHVIRDEQELESVISYTLNNPVKAGFVDVWQEWDYSYCKPEFRERFINQVSNNR